MMKIFEITLAESKCPPESWVQRPQRLNASMNWPIRKLVQVKSLRGQRLRDIVGVG